MYTVLLDSSNVNLSVGLAKDDVLLKEISYEAWQQQSEYMIVELNKILEEFSVEYKDIDSIMVAVGPGSYTGVRIAVSIAKVMALTLNIPIYPVSSLRVLKDDDAPSICLINARSKRSYFAVYEGKGIIINDTIKTNDEVLEYIKAHPDYSVCGETKYLGIEGKDTNLCKQMIDLMEVVAPLEDTLGLKPVYMKD